jgi:hypothetical protein
MVRHADWISVAILSPFLLAPAIAAQNNDDAPSLGLHTGVIRQEMVYAFCRSEAKHPQSDDLKETVPALAWCPVSTRKNGAESCKEMSFWDFHFQERKIAPWRWRIAGDVLWR